MSKRDRYFNLRNNLHFVNILGDHDPDDIISFFHCIQKVYQHVQHSVSIFFVLILMVLSFHLQEIN
jgi:hypothetical protein